VRLAILAKANEINQLKIMTKNSIQELVLKYIFQFQFDAENIDYLQFEKHRIALQVLAKISNSGISIFDLNKKQIIFFSSNYGKLLR
jgi:hypothetical protein